MCVNTFGIHMRPVGWSRSSNERNPTDDYKTSRFWHYYNMIINNLNTVHVNYCHYNCHSQHLCYFPNRKLCSLTPDESTFLAFRSFNSSARRDTETSWRFLRSTKYKNVINKIVMSYCCMVELVYVFTFKLWKRMCQAIGRYGHYIQSV